MKTPIGFCIFEKLVVMKTARFRDKVFFEHTKPDGFCMFEKLI